MIFNPAVPYEVPHMILAAYLVTCFLVASVYAVGMLRGRRDRHHRLGLLIPLTVGCILAPIQFMVGDTAAREIAKDQPIKFAAMECVQHTHSDVTEYIGGRCTEDGIKGGIGIPGLDSWLVGFSTDTEVIGLDTVPAKDRPPANTLLHLAFDAMVGIGTALIGLGLWFGIAWWRRRDIPQTKWFLRAVAVSGVATILALGSRLDRDRGRSPALDRLRGDADRGRGDRRQRNLGHLQHRGRPLRGSGDRGDLDSALDGAPLARGGDPRRRGSLRAQRRGARRDRPDHRRIGVSTADAVAGVLWVGATLYAVFGGADFGAGFWSLFAGSGERGERVRALIDWAIGPVWESNHVWLIFVLVVLWTAFSAAFAAVFSTLFIPLSLAALGIVLRGAGFAFHRLAPSARERGVSQALFGVSSLLTPFFMGTVVGAIASGRVPLGNAEGDPVTSWLNGVSLLTGALFVATSVYLAAVFLVSDSRQGRRRRARALLHGARPRRRSCGRCSRGGRDLRLPRRRPLHLRRPGRRGAAPGDPLGRLRPRSAGAAPPWRAPRCSRARGGGGGRGDLGLGRGTVSLPASGEADDLRGCRRP